MQKLFVYALLAAASLAGVQASTLQQLSLNDMIQQSTIIVRGKTQLSGASPRGSVIFTHYQLQVTETYKGNAAKVLDIVVPGGMANGLRQSFAGAPTLLNGQDYVLFLWTSKSGLTQVIGLSQGLFGVTANAAGQTMVLRAPTSELMLNATGQPVTDSALQMSLSDLKARIQSVLSGGSQ